MDIVLVHRFYEARFENIDQRTADCIFAAAIQFDVPNISVAAQLEQNKRKELVQRLLAAAERQWPGAALCVKGNRTIKFKGTRFIFLTELSFRRMISAPTTDENVPANTQLLLSQNDIFAVRDAAQNYKRWIYDSKIYNRYLVEVEAALDRTTTVLDTFQEQMLDRLWTDARYTAKVFCGARDANATAHCLALLEERAASVKEFRASKTLKYPETLAFARTTL